jgi:hypothetical protein
MLWNKQTLVTIPSPSSRKEWITSLEINASPKGLHSHPYLLVASVSSFKNIFCLIGEKFAKEANFRNKGSQFF